MVSQTKNKIYSCYGTFAFGLKSRKLREYVGRAIRVFFRRVCAGRAHFRKRTERKDTL